MCGRFDNLIARDAYRGLFKAERLPRSNFPLRYNIAPTDQIPIVRIDPRDGEREVVMARWGLIPFWMKEKPKVPHINARAETVDRLPLFREAFAQRRCLIPATGFYEWQKREDGKQPYRFRRKDLEPFYFFDSSSLPHPRARSLFTTRAQIAWTPKGPSGAIPRSAKRGAARTAANWGRLSRCQPNAAPFSKATCRTSSFAASALAARTRISSAGAWALSHSRARAIRR
jgi:SOS response associated peptidase (SRAP)